MTFYKKCQKYNKINAKIKQKVFGFFFFLKGFMKISKEPSQNRNMTRALFKHNWQKYDFCGITADW